MLNGSAPNFGSRPPPPPNPVSKFFPKLDDYQIDHYCINFQSTHSTRQLISHLSHRQWLLSLALCQLSLYSVESDESINRFQFGLNLDLGLFLYQNNNTVSDTFFQYLTVRVGGWIFKFLLFLVIIGESFRVLASKLQLEQFES